MKEIIDLFRLCPPPQYVMLPQLQNAYGKSLCKNMASASGGGGQTERNYHLLFPLCIAYIINRAYIYTALNRH